ncbi:MAG TPA: aspartate kinase [Candidatus Aminicenantes bacterium]|nr:aspartate kinase [Candidatus Aminicenantes bacterium]
MKFQKVMKFGGGCLRDADGLRRAAAVIRREPVPPAVVVSAVAGVTDELERGLARAVRNEAGIARTIGALRLRHDRLVSGLLAAPEVRAEVAAQIERRLARLERLLLGAALIGEVSPHARAHVLSFGERWAALLLAGVLREAGADARALESEQIGLAADDVAEGATADLAAFRRAVRKNALGTEAGRFVPVITGFYGLASGRRVVSFGRNGSDYSAAVVAAALRAPLLEIWKDVDGFMTADPRRVPGARPVARLSFAEAAELAYFGAKVLHPRALEPVAREKGTIRIRHLFQPDRPGTEIAAEGGTAETVLKSVTSNDRIAVLRVSGPGVGFRPGVIGDIGRSLADRGVNILSVITAQTAINVLVAEEDARRARRILRGIRRGVVTRVELETGLALVAAVGEGLASERGLAARVFAAVADNGVNVEMISSGASSAAAYFLVRKADVLPAVRALHAEFFEARANRPPNRAG